LVCGRFQFECANGKIVLASLPAAVILRATEGRDASHIQCLIRIIRTELEEDRPESAFISTGLASTLMTMVLRAHLKSGLQNRGVLALLACPQTARALEAMLKELDRDWTLETLARHANTSRATLVRLFKRTVDTSPLAFLADLRLMLARNRMLATNSPLAVIAESVGYQSDTAFNRAFRRRFGVCPGEMRRRATPSVEQASA
jgi:AraC family transcriptional activator of mtrCDE